MSSHKDRLVRHDEVSSNGVPSIIQRTQKLKFGNLSGNEDQ